jgi:SpoVK/Ycf46/Vps4 family AAA+-type ATPase
MLDAIHHENQPTLREKYLDHFLFLGNPGTGKTTTARLVGEVFNRLGFLKTRNLVEVSAVDLIAGYVGQTPERTRKVVESAFDGILFIDEAYSLIQMRGGSQDGFGKEVIDTLVKLIDQYRNRFVVIMAGYPDEMIELVHSNPGLSSRFTKTILFPDFTDDQLGEIFLGISNREGYVVHDEVLSQVKDILNQTRILSPRTFGNARDVHRLFRHMVQNLANRIISYPIFDGDRPKLPQGWNSFVIQDVDAFDVIVDHNPSIIENYPYGVEQKQMKKRKL